MKRNMNQKRKRENWKIHFNQNTSFTFGQSSQLLSKKPLHFKSLRKELHRNRERRRKLKSRKCRHFLLSQTGFLKFQLSHLQCKGFHYWKLHLWWKWLKFQFRCLPFKRSYCYKLPRKRPHLKFTSEPQRFQSRKCLRFRHTKSPRFKSSHRQFKKWNCWKLMGHSKPLKYR